MTTLFKYLRLYKTFFKASLIADVEFRANFVLRLITDIFWYIAQIFTFEVLFQHTELIGSWNLNQTRVFLGLVFIVDAIFMVLFSENLGHLSEKVRKGQLDLLLTKPINSQFMISTQRAGTAMLGNLLIAIGYFVWGLLKLENLEWPRLFWLIILIPTGVICFYTFRFVFAALALIFTRAESLDYLWYQIYKLGLRPDSIYSPWLRYVLLSIVPVAVIASVPARSILEEPDYFLFAWALGLAIFLLYLSHRFWKYCLRNYTSASS